MQTPFRAPKPSVITPASRMVGKPHAVEVMTKDSEARGSFFGANEVTAFSESRSPTFTKAVHYHCARAANEGETVPLDASEIKGIGRESDRSKEAVLAPGARVAIRNYSRMAPWLDLRDIEQEAHLASLESSRTWRPDGTASRDWHEARIVALALSRLVAEARCPVSLPKHRGEKGACNGKEGTRDRWADAAAAGRAPLTWSGEDGSEVENPALASVAAEQFEPAEVILDRERAHAEIRRILDEQTEAARAVLLEEEKSAEVAQRMGLSVREVYDATAAAMAALRAAFACQVAA